MVSPGAIRRLSLARATGHQGVAGAVDLGRVEPGDRQRRPGPEPLDDRPLADPLDPLVRARLGAQPLLGVLDVGRRALEQARDRHVAGVVVQARDHPAQRHDRVGHQAAPHAGVDSVAQGAHLDVGADQAAQRRGERGLADVPVAGVGDHDDVGAQLVLVLLQQRRQGVGADLLLALDEEHDVDGQVVAVRPERPEVRHDAGLVVGGAAGVEPRTLRRLALGGLERRRVPVGRVVLGLYVVVRVQQHRRRTLRPALVRDDRGRAALGADDVDRLAPLGAQQVGHRVGADRHTSPVRAGSALTDWMRTRSSRSDAQGGHQVAHRCAEVVGHDTDHMSEP